MDTFYSRNHGPIPDLPKDAWRLEIGGLVDTPLSLSFDELTNRFPTYAVMATLQCAGNRRTGFNRVREIVGEDAWGPRATSTAEWRGVRLKDVLRAAGVASDPSLYVALVAADVSALADHAQPYGRSIPLQKAMSDEVLLAWGMNCQPLPRIHGGPVRLVAPGYIGARSIKWISSITVQTDPSDNYFQASAYRILPADTDPDAARLGDGIALSSVALNRDVVSPDDGSTVQAGPLTLRCYAFVGDDRAVARIDVSCDGGRIWAQADREPELGDWTWRLWSFRLCAAPGPPHVTVRAWDSTGATQPESAASLWNPKGYANNSWAHVGLDVA